MFPIVECDLVVSLDLLAGVMLLLVCVVVLELVLEGKIGTPGSLGRLVLEDFVEILAIIADFHFGHF